MLRDLYGTSSSFRAIFDHFASRQRALTKTTVDRIQQNVIAEGHDDVTRRDVISFYREVEAAGCGRFVVGRKGHESRFDWHVSLASVGQVAAGETEEFESVDEIEGDEASEEMLLRHRFRLRPDLELSLDLPANLTSAEANRLAGFLQSLPFQRDE
ncbi:MAG: hypothetical protein WD294_07980 [Phycisphaeraceae bacterium]